VVHARSVTPMVLNLGLVEDVMTVMAGQVDGATPEQIRRHLYLDSGSTRGALHPPPRRAAPSYPCPAGTPLPLCSEGAPHPGGASHPGGVSHPGRAPPPPPPRSAPPYHSATARRHGASSHHLPLV